MLLHTYGIVLTLKFILYYVFLYKYKTYRKEAHQKHTTTWIWKYALL